MSVVINLIKVWIHCLLKIFHNFRGEYHRMCSMQVTWHTWKGPKHHYCECGYGASQFVKDQTLILRPIKENE